jgi:hypothetical protein
MDFIMPNFAKQLKSSSTDWLKECVSLRKIGICSLSLSILLGFFVGNCFASPSAEDFSSQVRFAKLDNTASPPVIEAEFNYRLSPTAEEALHKGIPLAWDVLIEIREAGFLLDSLIYQKKLSYILQFHALLNQYEVKTISQAEMFLTLNAALNFMATLHDITPLERSAFKPSKKYTLGLKTDFNREFLPIPLRPVAYLDKQWFLSSNWFLWPIQK